MNESRSPPQGYMLSIVVEVTHTTKNREAYKCLLCRSLHRLPNQEVWPTTQAPFTAQCSERIDDDDSTASD
ncbi:hypothetical protein Ptr902_10650 [Pyrenophora tritici-repentis]|nr:hypothetical protein Ptr902_10650 [Pyrenophora tritici-repentis]